MRTPVHRHDARVVNHLVQYRDVLVRLDELDVVVVHHRQHGRPGGNVQQQRPVRPDAPVRRDIERDDSISRRTGASGRTGRCCCTSPAAWAARRSTTEHTERSSSTRDLPASWPDRVYAWPERARSRAFVPPVSAAVLARSADRRSTTFACSSGVPVPTNLDRRYWQWWYL